MMIMILMMMMTNKQGGDKRSTQLWDLDSTLPCSRLSGNPRHQIIIVMTKTTKTKTNPRHQIIIVNAIVNIIATNMSSQIANVLLGQGAWYIQRVPQISSSGEEERQVFSLFFKFLIHRQVMTKPKLREIEIKGWKTNTTKTQTQTKAKTKAKAKTKGGWEQSCEGFLLRVWWIIHRREVEGRHLVQLPQWHRWSNQIWKLTAYSTIPAKSGKSPWKNQRFCNKNSHLFNGTPKFVKTARAVSKKNKEPKADQSPPKAGGAAQMSHTNFGKPSFPWAGKWFDKKELTDLWGYNAPQP